jgi:multicomponent K+:H+ antiporter subunit F
MTIDWLNLALQISIGAVSFSIALCTWRLLIGPSVIDRLLALDTLFLNGTALIIILGMYWHSFIYFEAALLVAMVGFVSTAALARYFTTGHIID